MKIYSKSVSFLALGVMLCGAMLCIAGKVGADTNRLLIQICTLVWFIVTPAWMQKSDLNDNQSVIG